MLPHADVLDQLFESWGRSVQSQDPGSGRVVSRFEGKLRCPLSGVDPRLTSSLLLPLADGYRRVEVCMKVDTVSESLACETTDVPLVVTLGG